MNDEQYKHIENRIKEAAENVEFPFDEFSWKEMEKKLDTGKDRKPFFFWFIPVGVVALLLFSLLLYRNYYSVSGPENSAAVVKLDKPVLLLSTVKKLNQTALIVPDTRLFQEKKAIIPPASLKQTSDSKKNNSLQVRTKANFNLTGSIVNLAGNVETKRAGIVKNKHKQSGHFTSSVTNGELTQDNQQNTSEIVVAEDKYIKTESASVTPEVNSVIEPKTVTEPAIKAKPEVQKSVVEVKPETQREKKDISHSKKKSSGNAHFYVLGSVGADISNVKLFSFKNSPVSPKYGVGVGFQINRRWAVQTGFYASAKKYVAGPADYKLSDNPYWSNVQIVGVDANCLVYEIPVTVRFNILQNTKISLYSSAGLSSYLMKKESYDYDYIRYNTPYENYYDYTGNKSLFGVLSLSAGVEKPLNSRFSLLAEPFINIPLSGVGEGKVKLYSFGLQTGVKYKFR